MRAKTKGAYLQTGVVVRAEDDDLGRDVRDADVCQHLRVVERHLLGHCVPLPISGHDDHVTCVRLFAAEEDSDRGIKRTWGNSGQLAKRETGTAHEHCMAAREMTRFWTAGFMLLVCGWVGVQGAEGEIKNKDGVRKRGAGDGGKPRVGGGEEETEEGVRKLLLPIFGTQGDLRRVASFFGEAYLSSRHVLGRRSSYAGTRHGS